MKRYGILIVSVLLVFMVAWTAFGQREGGQSSSDRVQDREGLPMFQLLSPEEAAELREKWPNMSQEERGKFRNKLREKWESLSDEEREKFRNQIRERFGSRRRGLGREEQLEAIKVIEEQLVKIKAAVENTIWPETRYQFQELSEEERAKLREKIATAMRERQMAITEIEQQIEKLRAPKRPRPERQRQIRELKEIYDLAVKEKATQTAKRLEELIASYRSEAQDRMRPTEPRPRGDVQRLRRDRPVRQEKAKGEDSVNKAPEFTLKSFDGKTISLSDYKGKIVVLEWFNFECPFVQHHYDKATTMIDLANKYKNKNVVWLAINSTSHTTPEANKAFTEKHKLPYLILDDRSGKIGRAYGAKTTPHMYIIDTKGNLAYEGAIDNSPMGKTPAGAQLINYIDKALSELTAGRAVIIKETKSYGCTVKYAK